MKIISIVIFLIFATTTLYAQNKCVVVADTTNNDIKEKTLGLNEVVVTATRTPKSLKSVPITTRLITSDEIKKSDATNIQDLLTEELPGLEFGYAMSQETTLSMNGFGGSAILFLVDGERLAGETMDNVDYNRLNLDNIGRIEIVKGAASALYGANAVGGVVNLISREYTDPWHLNVNSRYRHPGNEWRIGGEASFNTRKWNSNTTAQWSRVSTIKLADAFDTQSRIHEIFGGEVLNVKEKITYHITNDIKLIARGSYFDRISTRSNYDDHYNDYSGGLRTTMNLNGRNYLELSYGYDQYDKARFIGGKRTHDHDYSNRQHTLRSLYSKFWDKYAFTAGADMIHDWLRTYQFVNGETHSQTNIDAFAQFDWNPASWLNLIGAVRYDYFSGSHANAVTGRFAIMFKLKPATIRTSYAGGFRAPTLKEMYMNFDMAGIQMIYGNPDLKPERSHNLNIAMERNGYVHSTFLKGAYSMTVTGGFNYYDRRITTMDFPGDGTREEGAVYTNEDGVKVGNIEVSFRYKLLTGIGLKAGYNYLHTWGRSIDSQFTQPRPHTATWRLDYERNLASKYRFYVALSGRYLSAPETDMEETDGAYSLWKLTFTQRIWKGIDVNLIIDNLFNYRPKVYYWNSAPTTGLGFSLGVTIDLNTII